MNEEQKTITEYFITFVREWVRDFDHWRARGHLLIHVRNLGIAAMRFAEKLDELTAADNAEKTPPAIETNWGAIYGLFRRR